MAQNINSPENLARLKSHLANALAQEMERRPIAGEDLAQAAQALETLCRTAGWLYTCHHTGDSAQAALLWTYAALERRR